MKRANESNKGNDKKKQHTSTESESIHKIAMKKEFADFATQLFSQKPALLNISSACI